MYGTKALPPPRIPAALRLALASLLALATAGLVSPQAWGQDEKDLKLKLHFSFKDEAAAAKGGVSLRPNVAQEVFVFVENEDDDADQEVTVQLLAGGAPELSQKVTAKKGAKTRVVFEKAPPAAKALTGTLTFRALNKDGKFNPGLDARLQVARPRTYIEPTALYTPGDSNRFELTVAPKKDIAPGGPAARFELEVSPENIPGLTPGQKKAGRYSGFLPLIPGSSLTLDARDLKFDTAKDHKGVIFVTVDGYRRAITADTTFALAGAPTTPDLFDDPSLSLPLPRYSRPATLTLPVHADGNIAWDDRIKIQLAAGKKKDAKEGEDPRLWADVAEVTGPREVKYSYTRGPGGGLLVTPAVSDWKVALDFSGVFDKTEVRLVLLDKAGKARSLRDGSTRAVSGDAVIQSVVFDDSPPEALEFEAPPKAGYKGRDLRVFAKAKDSESGIAEVYFLAGKPGEGGKMPPGAVKVPGELVEDTNLYGAWFNISPDAKGPVEVTVVAVNRVGLASTRTLTIPRLDPPPDTASIAGRVFEMDTPVDNLAVVLLDDKGQELAMERTAGGGKFLFTGIEPGSYALFARKEANGFRALRKFTIVGKEQLTGQDLKLEAPPQAVKAPKKEEKKDEKNARIKGAVVEGERPQNGIQVVLTDLEAKKVVGTATTNASGAYEFKDLPKGKYAVTASKSASNTKARKDVELAAGEEKAGVELKLFR
jgi:hypothetical protein